MCLAVPLQVKKVHKQIAFMSDGRKVGLGLVGTVKPNEWLLVKTNLAVEKLAAREARLMQQALKENVNVIGT